jgi:hypothetical protein
MLAPATCTIDPSRYHVVTSVDHMNTKLQVIKDIAMGREQKVVSLDMEWDTRKDAGGEITYSKNNNGPSPNWIPQT